MTLRPIDRMRRALAVAALGLGMLALATGCDPRALAYFLQPFEPQVEPDRAVAQGQEGRHPHPRRQRARRSTSPTWRPTSPRDWPAPWRARSRRSSWSPTPRSRSGPTPTPNYTDPPTPAAPSTPTPSSSSRSRTSRSRAPKPRPLPGGLPDPPQGLRADHPHRREGQGDPRPRRARSSSPTTRPSRPPSPGPRGPCPPAAPSSAPTFKRKFLDVVIAELSWHFIPHATGEMVQDTTF